MASTWPDRLSHGARDRTSAAWAATCGAAIDVPDHLAYVPPGNGPTTSDPRAATSTQTP
jgi:hypothetical protein